LLTLSDFLLEVKKGKVDPPSWEAGLPSDPKGKIHELIVAWYLNGNRFPAFFRSPPKKGIPSKSPSQYYKYILDTYQLTAEELKYHRDRAKIAADELREYAWEKYGKEIKQIWWTHNAKDIEKLMGIPDPGNASDIVLEFTDGTFLGDSLKATKKSKPATIANRGQKALDALFGIPDDASPWLKITKKAQKQVAKNIVTKFGRVEGLRLDKDGNVIYKDTRSPVTQKTLHVLEKKDSALLAKNHDVMVKAYTDIISSYIPYFNSIPQEEIRNVFMDFAQVKNTKMPMVLQHTSGDGSQSKTIISNLAAEINEAFDAHEGHLLFKASGGNVYLRGFKNTTISKLNFKSIRSGGTGGIVILVTAPSPNAMKKENQPPDIVPSQSDVRPPPELSADVAGGESFYSKDELSPKRKKKIPVPNKKVAASSKTTAAKKTQSKVFGNQKTAEVVKNVIAKKKAQTQKPQGNKVNWDAVERMYRNTKKSEEDIGRLFGITKDEVDSHRRSGGWLRGSQA